MISASEWGNDEALQLLVWTGGPGSIQFTKLFALSPAKVSVSPHLIKQLGGIELTRTNVKNSGLINWFVS